MHSLLCVMRNHYRHLMRSSRWLLSDEVIAMSSFDYLHDYLIAMSLFLDFINFDYVLEQPTEQFFLQN